MPEDRLKKWLEKRKYDCFYNYPLGGKIPDLIAIKDSDILAFEQKKNAKDIPTAIGQCLFFLKECNRIYIVLPQKERDYVCDSDMDTLRMQGIGLIIFGERSVDVIIKARKFQRDVSSVIDEIRSKCATKKSKEVCARDKIVEILTIHPEGMTNSDMSKLVGLSRQSLSKYVYQLLGEGIIMQREIGTARMCYLKVRKNARK
jgi:hypothetical protein